MGEALWEEYTREVEETEAEWKKRFANHIATLTTYTRHDGEKVEELHWANPATNTDSLTYHSIGARLIVTGDLYDAIYVRAEGLRWWASVNWDYFASKCVASPEGRLFQSWDPDRAQKHIRSHLQEVDSEARIMFEETDGPAALESEYEWMLWMRNNGHNVFGDDCWELGDIGKGVDWVCKCHLYGLKIAIAQLDAQAVHSPTKTANV